MKNIKNIEDFLLEQKVLADKPETKESKWKKLMENHQDMLNIADEETVNEDINDVIEAIKSND